MPDFTIPNFAATNYPVTSRHFQLDAEVLGRLGLTGYNPDVWSWIGAATPPRVDVFLGSLIVYGGDCTINGRHVWVPINTFTISPDATNPRWCIVEVDSGGKIIVTHGTPHATDPVPPTPSSARLLLAAIYLLANDTLGAIAAAVGTANNRLIQKLTPLRRGSTQPVYRTQPTPVPAGQPQSLGNYYSYNSVSHTGPNLTTKWSPNFRGASVGAWLQFFVFIGTDRQPYISRRVLPYGEWEATVNLKSVLGNVDIENDNHNGLAVAVSDTDGLIHVTGNHHGDPLRYATGNRFDTANFASVTWTNRANQVAAGDEDGVTYPTLFRRPDGALCMIYTNMEVPGDITWGRNTYINRYTPGGTPGTYGSWTRLVHLLDGALGDPATNENQRTYFHDVAVDYARNRIWVFFMWRWAESGSALEHNWGFYVVCSEDGGSTWKSFPAGSGGVLAAQTVPVTPANAPPMTIATPGQPTAPGNTTTTQMNGGGACVDAFGRPHAIFQRMIAGTYPSNMTWASFHVWFDDRVTPNTWARGYRQIAQSHTYGRSVLVGTPDGDVLMFNTSSYLGRGGTRSVIRLTPEDPEYVPTADGDITPDTTGQTNVAFGAWTPAIAHVTTGLDERALEVTHDREALRLLGQHYSLWTQPADEGDAAHSAQSTYFVHVDNWKGWGMILGTDLAQIDDVFRGKVKPVSVETWAQRASWPVDIPVTSAVVAVLPTIAGNVNAYVRIEADDFNHKWVVARIRARAQVSAEGTTLRLQIRELADDATVTYLGNLCWNDPNDDYGNNDIGAYVTKQTPWLPLATLAQFRQYGTNAKDGRIDVVAFKEGAGTATIQGGSLQLEVAVIDRYKDD